MSLWNRQYRLNFPEIKLEYANTLKIAFNVDKDLTRESNKCKVSIWNLSDESRKKIEKEDVKVELYAGYKDNSGPVRMFIGSVITSQSRDTGKDIITELTLSDGQVAIRDSIFSISFAPETDGRRIIQYIADEMGLALVFGDGVKIGTYQNGYSFIGKGADALDEICKAQGCNWSIQNEVLQIIMQGGTSKSMGLVFSTGSSLIGSPERIVKANVKENKDTPKRKRRKKEGKEGKQAGWKIKTLLAPTVNPGDAVKVESRVITGWFKVETISHSGDTHAGDWISEMTLIERLIYTDGTKKQSSQTDNQ